MQTTGLRTPRTPAAATDKILQEAQNLLALTHVETPLMGGSNPVLYNPDFSGATPSKDSVATPNTVLSTPFRTPRDSAGSNTPGMLSIASGATPQTGARLPGSTPMLRDKLNINPEDTPDVLQRTLKDQLKRGLSSLPAPKNDYEIVVPEDEMDTSDGLAAEGEVSASQVEDQADIDARIETERRNQSNGSISNDGKCLDNLDL